MPDIQFNPHEALPDDDNFSDKDDRLEKLEELEIKTDDLDPTSAELLLTIFRSFKEQIELIIEENPNDTNYLIQTQEMWRIHREGLLNYMADNIATLVKKEDQTEAKKMTRKELEEIRSNNSSQDN